MVTYTIYDIGASTSGFLPAPVITHLTLRCGLQSCLDWVEMGVGFSEDPSYYGHTSLIESIFRRAAP